MDWTLRQIQNELAQIPGFLRFQLEVTGDEIAICVIRRSPHRRMWEKGILLPDMVEKLIERGQSPGGRGRHAKND